mgnify:CR=1 FL=1
MPDGIAPPVLVGVAVGDMTVPLVNVNELGEYEIKGGSKTWIVNSPFLLSPVLEVAVKL